MTGQKMNFNERNEKMEDIYDQIEQLERKRMECLEVDDKAGARRIKKKIEELELQNNLKELKSLKKELKIYKEVVKKYPDIQQKIFELMKGEAQ